MNDNDPKEKEPQSAKSEHEDDAVESVASTEALHRVKSKQSLSNLSLKGLLRRASFSSTRLNKAASRSNSDLALVNTLSSGADEAPPVPPLPRMPPDANTADFGGSSARPTLRLKPISFKRPTDASQSSSKSRDPTKFMLGDDSPEELVASPMAETALSADPFKRLDQLRRSAGFAELWGTGQAEEKEITPLLEKLSAAYLGLTAQTTSKARTPGSASFNAQGSAALIKAVMNSLLEQIPDDASVRQRIAVREFNDNTELEPSLITLSDDDRRKFAEEAIDSIAKAHASAVYVTTELLKDIPERTSLEEINSLLQPQGLMARDVGVLETGSGAVVRVFDDYVLLQIDKRALPNEANPLIKVPLGQLQNLPKNGKPIIGKSVEFRSFVTALLETLPETASLGQINALLRAPGITANAAPENSTGAGSVVHRLRDSVLLKVGDANNRGAHLLNVETSRLNREAEVGGNVSFCSSELANIAAMCVVRQAILDIYLKAHESMYQGQAGISSAKDPLLSDTKALTKLIWENTQDESLAHESAQLAALAEEIAPISDAQILLARIPELQQQFTVLRGKLQNLSLEVYTIRDRMLNLVQEICQDPPLSPKTDARSLTEQLRELHGEAAKLNAISEEPLLSQEKELVKFVDYILQVVGEETSPEMKTKIRGVYVKEHEARQRGFLKPSEKEELLTEANKVRVAINGVASIEEKKARIEQSRKQANVALQMYLAFNSSGNEFDEELLRLAKTHPLDPKAVDEVKSAVEQIISNTPDSERVIDEDPTLLIVDDARIANTFASYNVSNEEKAFVSALEFLGHRGPARNQRQEFHQKVKSHLGAAVQSKSPIAATRHYAKERLEWMIQQYSLPSAVLSNPSPDSRLANFAKGAVSKSLTSLSAIIPEKVDTPATGKRAQLAKTAKNAMNITLTPLSAIIPEKDHAPPTTGHETSGQTFVGEIFDATYTDDQLIKLYVVQAATPYPIVHHLDPSKIKFVDDKGKAIKLENGQIFRFQLPKELHLMTEAALEQHFEVLTPESFFEKPKLAKIAIKGDVAKVTSSNMAYMEITHINDQKVPQARRPQLLKYEIDPAKKPAIKTQVIVTLTTGIEPPSPESPTNKRGRK